MIVADEADWQSRQPHGLPFFNDDDGQIRPGIVVMPAGSSLDLRPFSDLVTLREFGHVFEMLGNLRLSAFWLGEIFANLALSEFIAPRQPESCQRAALTKR